MKKISVGKFSDIVWIFMENVSIRGSFSIKNTLLVGFGPAFPASRGSFPGVRWREKRKANSTRKKAPSSGEGAALSCQKLKVALNPIYKIFLNFAESCVLSCLPKTGNIKKFHRAVFELQALKAVIKGLFRRLLQFTNDWAIFLIPWLVASSDKEWF